MSIFQIFLLVLAIYMVYLYLKRSLMSKNTKHYDAGEVKNKIKNNHNIILLDVRTYAERNKHAIKGSIHIPLHELTGRVEELNKFKDKEIVCYCQSGNRSLSAAVKLKKRGFNSANLKGGISNWNLNS